MLKLPQMNKQDVDTFLDIECVITAARELGIIGEEPINLEKVNNLKSEIQNKSPEVFDALEKFQKAYKEWFEKITKANTGQVSQDDIDIILKKDKLRKQLMDACSAAKSSK